MLLLFSISQIGVLYTARDDSEAAVRFNLRSLAIRAEIGSPEIGTDLHWLGEQRGALGAEVFERIVRQQVGGAADAGVILQLLDDYARSRRGNDAPPGTE